MSLVSSFSGSGTSATMSSHSAGDMILIWAFRDGSTTSPTLSAGFTNVAIAPFGNVCSGRVGYKIAASSSETSGTWANATQVGGVVIRGADRCIGYVGQTAASTSVTYGAVTLTDTSGSSWVVGMAGHRSIDTLLETPPTGMANDLTFVDGTAEIAIHSLKGTATNWASTAVSVGGTSSGWVSATFEVIAAGHPVMRRWGGVPFVGGFGVCGASSGDGSGRMWGRAC